MENDTINFLGINASKILYERNKQRIDRLVAESQRHASRLDVIEREATHVIRISDETIRQITGNNNREIKFIK